MAHKIIDIKEKQEQKKYRKYSAEDARKLKNRLKNGEKIEKIRQEAEKLSIPLATVNSWLYAIKRSGERIEGQEKLKNKRKKDFEDQEKSSKVNAKLRQDLIIQRNEFIDNLPDEQRAITGNIFKHSVICAEIDDNGIFQAAISSKISKLLIARLAENININIEREPNAETRSLLFQRAMPYIREWIESANSLGNFAQDTKNKIYPTMTEDNINAFIDAARKFNQQQKKEEAEELNNWEVEAL
jgi:hypothetical protein